jgi:predicted nucleic acid-binding protein
VAEQWVINASPLIVLAKVGQIHLLTALATEVVVPDMVAAEINEGPADDPAR